MKIHITCKQASKMIQLNEEHRLSLFQRVRLAYHLFICKACKLFLKQHQLLNKYWKHAREADVCLTDAEKKDMANRMNQE